MASVHVILLLEKFTEEETGETPWVLIEGTCALGNNTLYDFMRLYMQEGNRRRIKEKDSGYFLMDLLYFRQQKKEQPLSTLFVGYLREDRFLL